MGKQRSKQQWSWCGGRCNEASALTELYHPTKLKETIVFERVQYCTNHGCGWRLKLPDITIGAGINYPGDSEAIKKYLRKAQKRFHIPNLSVQTLWRVWVQGRNVKGPLDFEEYLKELTSRSVALTSA